MPFLPYCILDRASRKAPIAFIAVNFIDGLRCQVLETVLAVRGGKIVSIVASKFRLHPKR
jgi:hypothetical protein